MAEKLVVLTETNLQFLVNREGILEVSGVMAGRIYRPGPFLEQDSVAWWTVVDPALFDLYGEFSSGDNAIGPDVDRNPTMESGQLIRGDRNGIRIWRAEERVRRKRYV